MAVHLLIDGYNLIGSEKGLTGKLEERRKRLLDRLQRYRAIKGHSITVVFDGWRNGWVHEIEERVGDVTVIFSKRGETADEVILRLASELGERCVVVSSDRELQRSAAASGAATVYAGEFRAALEGPETSPPSPRRNDPSKRGNPRRASRKERKRLLRLKKL
jgi:predicted RNA-binding protein with PIN domain